MTSSHSASSSLYPTTSNLLAHPDLQSQLQTSMLFSVLSPQLLENYFNSHSLKVPLNTLDLDPYSHSCLGSGILMVGAVGEELHWLVWDCTVVYYKDLQRSLQYWRTFWMLHFISHSGYANLCHTKQFFSCIAGDLAFSLTDKSKMDLLNFQFFH
jgi:hypothetical protein